MAFVSCPSCGEKGRLPDQLAGKMIKCPKCGRSFEAVPATMEVPTLGHSTGTGSQTASIEVDGLDASTWSATAPNTEEIKHPREPDPTPESVPTSPEAPHRRYMVLTQRDRFFEGKFELARLEDALNHYASQGWVVRAMSTPHVTGFSGGPREEIVVLLER